MCEYCENKESIIVDGLYDSAVIEQMEDGEWVINASTMHLEFDMYDDDGDSYEVTEEILIPIDYCPKCGRKL